MSMLSRIRNLFARAVARTIRKAPSRPRPAVETLEDRTVPSTFIVTNTLDDGSNGSLRWAVAQANATNGADTIAFNDGTLAGTNFKGGTHTITLGGSDLELTDSATTTISGPGQSLLSIDGNKASRVFALFGSSALSGLTITGGNSDVVNSGGLFNGGTASLTDCTITGNSSLSVGGGVGNFGTLTMTNCTVTHNSAGFYGGGLFNAQTTSTLTLNNCTVRDNSATGGTGGGVANFAALTVTDSTFSGNSASGGGGLANFVTGSNAPTLNMSNSTVSGNSADISGGGFLNAGGAATLTNCTFNGNSASLGGGIVNDAAGTLNVTSCTISGNSANDGGGIDQRFGTMSLGNSIVAANTAPQDKDIRGVITTDLGHNLLGASLSGTTFGPGNVYTDTPMLGALANNGGPTQTMALLPGSPAIDAGDNALVAGITTDQGGALRTVGASVDIGAFEVQNQAPTVAVPGAQVAYEDVDMALTGISVGDSDGDNLAVTLSVSNGTLTLGTAAGLTVAGNGSGSVTLSGDIADLNSALAGLTYRGNLNYSGGDLLSIMVTDGSLNSSATVAINVVSAAQQAGDLQAQVSALETAGVLNYARANSLIVKLNLNGNNGDNGKMQAFLNEVQADLVAGKLNQAQADSLLYWGNILLLSMTR
jgi:hypothetical protein